ncbi:hypothetical protein, partial [Moorena sp. SIO4E2]|uniref:hypothetical protein n=1 Tax=Moorena sp. SIO4E2 TaxID=2607826 RepID=UPI00257FE07F
MNQCKHSAISHQLSAISYQQSADCFSRSVRVAHMLTNQYPCFIHMFYPYQKCYRPVTSYIHYSGLTY